MQIGQLGVSVLLVVPALYIVLSNGYPPQEKNWAIATLGTILGFWLRGKQWRWSIPFVVQAYCRGVHLWRLGTSHRHESKFANDGISCFHFHCYARAFTL